MRSKHKQNWINHLERMDNTRLPKHALNYKPRGRRDPGRPRKRRQRIDAGTDQTTYSMEEDDDDDDDDDDIFNSEMKSCIPFHFECRPNTRHAGEVVTDCSNRNTNGYECSVLHEICVWCIKFICC